MQLALAAHAGPSRPPKSRNVPAHLPLWSTTETVTPTNTHRFLCFHRVNARRIIRELRPFCATFGALRVASCHHLWKESSCGPGVIACRPNMPRAANQTWREKTQVERRSSMSSSSLWSHSGQQGWYGKPWRANLSTVQHLSNHRKNLQRSGAQDIHTVSLQGSKDVWSRQRNVDKQIERSKTHLTSPNYEAAK